MTTNIRVLHIDPLADTGIVPPDLERDASELVVRTADDRDVLDVISDENVDCVVSGYVLPEGDGIALSERVRNRFPDVPFVLCTTSGTEKIAGTAFETGIDGYVPTETDESRATELSETITRHHRRLPSPRAIQPLSVHRTGDGRRRLHAGL